MKREPLVSVIVPTYNRAFFIAAALESIKIQTYQNWECIVVDDGSTDATANIVSALCREDKRFQYYNRPDDFTKGANGSRNYGLSKCCGEYIGFCDDDDFWLHDKLEKQLAIFRKFPEYGLVTGNVEFVNADGVRTGRVIQQLARNGYVFEDFLLKNRMSMITPLLKKEIFEKIGGFNEEFVYSEDWEFWRRAAFYYKFYSIQQVLACVRKHEYNTTAKFKKEAIDQYLLYRKLNRALMDWGKDKFSDKDKTLIEKAEWLRLKQILKNHCKGLSSKCSFFLDIIKINCDYFKIVCQLFFKYGLLKQ